MTATRKRGGGTRATGAASAAAESPRSRVARRCPSDALTKHRIEGCRNAHRSRIPRARRAGYNRIPLVLESFADLDTPLSLYLKLAQRGAHSFLLESVVGGERFGRYSFIGLPAKTRIRARGTTIDVDDATARDRAPRRRSARVRRAITCKRFRAAPRAGPAALLRRARRLLRLRHACATSRRGSRAGAAAQRPDSTDVPDMLLLLTEELAVVDNLSGKISLIVYADPREPNAYAKAARAAARAAPQAARAGGDSVPDGPRERRGAQSEFGEDALQARGGRARRNTSPRAT